MNGFEIRRQELVELTGEIVSAYVAHNPVGPGNLPGLIGEVYAALVATAAPRQQHEQMPLRPAVPVRKSITPDFLISLEDGKRLKSLKRHLSTLGLTPAQYRARWNLPPDYPMVAPNYAAVRAELARAHQFGRTRRRR